MQLPDSFIEESDYSYGFSDLQGRGSRLVIKTSSAARVSLARKRASIEIRFYDASYRHF